MLTKKLALATAFTFLLAGASFAQTTYLTENFNYPTGPIVGATGSPWTTHSGTAGQVDVSNPSTVNPLVNVTGAETEDVSTPFNNGATFSSGLVTATFTINFSALPTSGTTTYFAHFKDNTATNFRGRVFSTITGAGTGNYRLGISSASTTSIAFVPTDLVLGTNYVLTLSLDAATGASSLAVDNGAAVASIDAPSALSVSTFALRQSTGEGTLTVDSLTVTSTGTPVPEPSTYAMIAGALGLLVFVQRMRRSVA